MARHSASTLRLFLALLGVGVGLSVPFLWGADLPSRRVESRDLTPPPVRTHKDSVKYPIRKTYPIDYRDVEQRSPADLQTPSNIVTEFVYDPATRSYLLVTKLNGKKIGTPLSYTPQQYLRLMAQKEQTDFFLQKDREENENVSNSSFNPFDIGFELGPAEKIFGPGGVKLKTQGSAEMSFGIKSNHTDNPSIPIHSRRHTFFDFDQKIQANMQASVGSKLNFGLNYNTEASFDFDSKRLRLAYEGEEDDIIKILEAGDVSLRTRNSLIQGGVSLFGIHSKMQFGKLDVDWVISQQEAETKRVSSERGAQTTAFEFSANNYDENRHFFLGHFFRDRYNQAMSTLPHISSGIKINRAEVWITNKRSRFDDARNIVAFSDLGEPKKVTASGVTPSGESTPSNSANSLYGTLNGMPEIRQIDRVSQLLSGLYRGGLDYEKVESARRLSSSEYTINEGLGYISLNVRLQPDEVLAVAYEYSYNGKVYQVGEFSSDRPDNSTQNLFVKLLKGTSMTPPAPYWKFMMRNIYSLGGNVSDLKEENFKLDVYYRSDEAGVALPYINEGAIQKKILLQVLGMDRLDRRGNPYPDGLFDYVADYTVLPRKGLIVFSTIEPFGETLAQKIGDNALAQKYCYYEIYDTTMVAAKLVAEKDKFTLRGEYQASTSGQISLGAVGNVTPGSVIVTAGGVRLTENVDYIVNYGMGTVTILNESILNSGTRIDVSLENKGFMNLQRKTMLGLDLNYHFTPDFTLGGTFMHLSEMPLTTKTPIGRESMKNTLWGLNLSYRKESLWLTDMLDYLPFVDVNKPSEIQLNGEFAHLIPGHYEGKYAKGYSYIDDFETSQSSIDLLNPYAWMLSSVPMHEGANALFPEASLVNNLTYGNRRARLAWFYIDPMFNRERSSLTPSYIRNNPDYISNHYVREIKTEELFPYRDENFGQYSYLQTLNLSYYPQERGAYNLNASDLNDEGLFTNPKKMWGGVMRKIETSDFESSNIEYIEFWLMDPFIYQNDPAVGGDLYLNLGDISEEVLKDEMKFFENGIPINDDPNAVTQTIWGKVPIRQGAGYAFDNTPGARAKQDVGFNGLSSSEEKSFPAYANYLNDLSSKINATTLSQWQEIPFSPLNDPAGDDFMHYRDRYFDDHKSPILERYKYYNGIEGNSAEADNQEGGYSIASRIVPDVEDINQDNTLNENERFFEYRISLRPSDMEVGNNYIVDERKVSVKLPNGKEETIKWFQFKVPIREYTGKHGSISDFKTIRFMRMVLTDFDRELFLRFGTFKLVRGEWRQYDRELHPSDIPPISSATLEVSTVNIEENGDRTPINYVLPPGVLRSLSPDQAQVTQQNEQSLSLKVKRLSPQDARAVYKNTAIDMRRYKRLELFTHAEALIDDETATASGDLEVFIRLGSDYKNNYYEYAVPLDLTPFGVYGDNYNDRMAVWPANNKIDLSLESLTRMKRRRNSLQSDGKAEFYKEWRTPDENNPRNTMAIVGNPSLSQVKTILIGVRNASGNIKSAEIWINELRLSEYQEQGGWATNADVQIKLSDIGSINAQGTYQTAGFGAIDQTLSQRRLEDLRQINLSSTFEFGKLFPDKAQIRIPLYYSYQDELILPQYNPQDQDILLQESLNEIKDRDTRDSLINQVATRTTMHSISLANIGSDFKSETPMPYDPANFSMGYSYNISNHHTPEVEYDRQYSWQAQLGYNYSPSFTPLKPFSFVPEVKGKSPISKTASTLRNYQLNWLPAKIEFSSQMMRNYSELQVRNLLPDASDFKLPVSFVQNFIWNRDFSINWNLTTNLKMSFSSSTQARIEEPHMQVNRELNPDGYFLWKDSVQRSLREMGIPMLYNQRAQATYTLPFALIPFLDWVQGTVSYQSTYNWERGAENAQLSYNPGHTIFNTMKVDYRLNFPLQQLYRKFSFYEEFEKRKRENAGNGRDARRNPRSRDNVSEKPTRTAPRKYTQEITFVGDSAIIVEHKLNSKNLQVTALNPQKRSYPIKSKTLDSNRVELSVRDSITLSVTISAIPPKERTPLSHSLTDPLISLVTMVTDVSVSYARNNSLHVPGFLPEIASWGGQNRQIPLWAPGLGFAFGVQGEDFVSEALYKGWLSTHEENVNPALYTLSEDATMRINLEPLPDLRISLSLERHNAQREETQFMFEGAPHSYGGSFSVSTIALKGLFSQSKGKDGYYSPLFEEFLSNRSIIAQRIQQLYGDHAPNNGVSVRENSADVLIPAFLAAYTGKSAQSISLSPFPSLWETLPNWSLTYTGLNRIEAVKDHFRNISLSHSYRSTYSVGSYSSFLAWQPLAETQSLPLGFIPNTQNTGERIASMPYDIPMVNIREGFSPLIGIEITFKNGMGISSRWNKSRDLSLNLSSFQILEMNNQEISVGLSYRIEDFTRVLGLKKGGNSAQPKQSSKQKNGMSSLLQSGGGLTLRADYSYNRTSMLFRKIQDNFTQATNGNEAHLLKCYADYALSKMISIRAYFDWNLNHPLVSSHSFPTDNTAFGVSVRFSLIQ